MWTSPESASKPLPAAETCEVVGDYHNGPLSVIHPLWDFRDDRLLLVPCGRRARVLSNYKYGDAALKNINTFLFAFFIAKFIFFMTIFGSLYVDLAAFAGLAGLSISLNGGVAQRQAEAPEPIPVINRFRLSPGLRRPVGI